MVDVGGDLVGVVWYDRFGGLFSCVLQYEKLSCIYCPCTTHITFLVGYISGMLRARWFTDRLVLLVLNAIPRSRSIISTDDGCHSELFSASRDKTTNRLLFLHGRYCTLTAGGCSW